jgi:hypothetical protein
MPIGSRVAGIATGPAVGPRYIDPAAGPITAGGLPVTPTGLSPAPAVVADAPTDTADILAWNGTTRLLGYSFSEEAGAAAKLILRDGNGTSGRVLAVISLAAGESTRDWFGPDGIQVNTGLYVDRTAGTSLGAIYHRPG